MHTDFLNCPYVLLFVCACAHTCTHTCHMCTHACMHMHKEWRITLIILIFNHTETKYFWLVGLINICHVFLCTCLKCGFQIKCCSSYGPRSGVELICTSFPSRFFCAVLTCSHLYFVGSLWWHLAHFEQRFNSFCSSLTVLLGATYQI